MLVLHDLQRAMKRPIVQALLLFGLVLGVLPIFTEKLFHFSTADQFITYPAGVYTFWLIFIPTTSLSIYKLIYPLLAAAAYGDVFEEDRITGLQQIYLTKMTKRKYTFTHVVSAFLVGGLTGTFPLLINFLVLFLVLPVIDTNVYFSMPIYGTSDFMPDFYYNHPFWFIVGRIGLDFLWCGILADCAVILGKWIQNRYFIIVAPFLILIVGDLFLETLFDYRYNLANQMITGLNFTYTTGWIVILLLFFIFVTVHFKGESYEDFE